MRLACGRGRHMHVRLCAQAVRRRRAIQGAALLALTAQRATGPFPAVDRLGVLRSPGRVFCTHELCTCVGPRAMRERTRFASGIRNVDGLHRARSAARMEDGGVVRCPTRPSGRTEQAAGGRRSQGDFSKQRQRHYRMGNGGNVLALCAASPCCRATQKLLTCASSWAPASCSLPSDPCPVMQGQTSVGGRGGRRPRCQVARQGRGSGSSRAERRGRDSESRQFWRTRRSM